MSNKPIVKECTACGQGFAEDNTEVGGRLAAIIGLLSALQMST